jgi:hypothetical protein
MAYGWTSAKWTWGAAFVAILMGCLTAHAPAHAADTPLTVVELFTSQGCNSCPPADAFLGEIKARDGVLALSLAVDYWDYMGWKDTFANRANTARQEAYKARMGEHQVYTPQIVIDGVAHTVGSKRQEVTSLLDQSAARGGKSAQVSLSAEDGALHVAIAETANAPDDATIWLVKFDEAQAVAIKSGENRGKTLTYHNIVRDMTPIGMWSGEAYSLMLPMRDLEGVADCYAVIVQADGVGEILGADMLALADVHANVQ